MNELGLVTTLKLRILAKATNELNYEKFIRFIVYIVIALIFAIGAYAFFNAMFHYLHNTPEIHPVGDLLISRILTLGFMTFFSMLAMSNIITAIPTLYRSSEVDFLLTTPLKYISIFTSKFLENVFYSSWAIMLLGTPIMFAYGKVMNAPLWFYIYIIIVYLIMVLLCASLGIALMILLARFFSGIKRWQVLTIISICAIIGTFFILQYLIPQGLVLRDAETMAEVNYYLSQLRLASPYLPNTWIEATFRLAVSGQSKNMLLPLTYLLSSALMLAQICFWIAEKWYYESFLRFNYHWGQRTKKSEKSKIYKVYWFLRLIPSPIKNILDKDIKVFIRDPIQWSQVMILFVLLLVYLLNIRNLPLDFTFTFWKTIISYVNFGFTGYVLATLSVRFIFPSISMEGFSFWVLGVAPLNMRTIFWEKFWLGFGFSFIFAEILTLVSGIMLDLDWLVLLLSAICIFLTSISLTGLSIGLGAYYPDFRSNNPSHIASSAGGMITVACALTYVGLMVVLLAWPLNSYFNSKMGNAVFNYSILYLSATFILILSFVTTFFPLWIGIRALRQYDF